MKFSVLLLACVLAAAALPASSAEVDTHGFYFGLSSGRARVDEGRYDASATRWGLFAGYRFGRHFALEGEYADAGTIEADDDPTGLLELEPRQASLRALGLLPLSERFSLYGALGATSWDFRHDEEDRIPGVEESGTDLSVAIGAQWQVSAHWASRFELTRARYGDIDVDALSAAVLWTF